MELNLTTVLATLTVGAVILLLAVLYERWQYRRTEKYDERQRIVQGRAARLSMVTGWIGMLLLSILLFVDLIWQRSGQYHPLFGTDDCLWFVYLMTLLTIGIYDCYCIIHDAFVTMQDAEEREKTEIGSTTILGGIWALNCLLSLLTTDRSVMFWIRWPIMIEFLIRGILLVWRRHRRKREERETD